MIYAYVRGEVYYDHYTSAFNLVSTANTLEKVDLSTMIQMCERKATEAFWSTWPLLGTVHTDV